MKIHGKKIKNNLKTGRIRRVRVPKEFLSELEFERNKKVDVSNEKEFNLFSVRVIYHEIYPHMMII